MAREVVYDLRSPGYTLYHRAALGGLAATLLTLGKDAFEGIESEVGKTQVRLRWGDALTDREATARLLSASFRLSEEKLIDLPGQQIPADRAAELRVAIHNGLCLTFLQHPKMRPGEKTPRRILVQTADGESAGLTYKALDDFAHRRAQGTGLLKGEAWPRSATISQSMIPGAMSGRSELEASPADALLLLYLMVGSAVYLLRPRTYQEKAQACFVVPNVIDLLAFTRSLRTLTARNDRLHSGSYFGRVVGGAEEAALRFLLDIEASDIADQRGVDGALVVAMGKVPWDKNQVNRSMHVRVRRGYREIEVFRAAWERLGESRAVRTKTGEAFVVPSSPVPELIAANLGAERHWCAGFTELVKEQREFRNALHRGKGFAVMKDSIQDQLDRAIIDAFHEAWRRTMGAFGNRARRDGVSFDRLVEVEQERTRNAILRAKTADALANWFLRFCADASSGGPLNTFREHGDTLRAFLFDGRNAERLQNLLIFGLVSYQKPVQADLLDYPGSDTTTENI